MLMVSVGSELDSESSAPRVVVEAVGWVVGGATSVKAPQPHWAPRQPSAQFGFFGIFSQIFVREFSSSFTSFSSNLCGFAVSKSMGPVS